MPQITGWGPSGSTRRGRRTLISIKLHPSAPAWVTGIGFFIESTEFASRS